MAMRATDEIVTGESTDERNEREGAHQPNWRPTVRGAHAHDHQSAACGQHTNENHTPLETHLESVSRLTPEFSCKDASVIDAAARSAARLLSASTIR